MVVMMVMIAIRAAYMVVVVVMIMVVIMRMVMVSMMVMIMVIVIAVGPAYVVGMVVVEEMRIVVQNALEVECAAIQHPVERDGGALGAVDDGVRVDGAHGRLDGGQFLRRDKVGLVDEHHVGKGDLVFRLAAVLQAQRQVLGIDKGDNRIKAGLGAHVVIHEEGLRDRNRVGKAGGFDDDGVETGRAAHQAFHHADQVAAHGAADAAIVHFVDFFVRLDDQVVVDADLAEFIDDDGITLAVVLGQDAVEKGGLARTQITRQDGHGDAASFSGRLGFRRSFGLGFSLAHGHAS